MLASQGWEKLAKSLRQCDKDTNRSTTQNINESLPFVFQGLPNCQNIQLLSQKTNCTEENLELL